MRPKRVPRFAREQCSEENQGKAKRRRAAALHRRRRTEMGTGTMAMADWRTEWHEFEGVTYLNVAGNSPVPKVAIKAMQTAVEWKKFPQRIPDAAFFEVPNRVRAAIAKLIGGKPEEIALTTGASTGMSAV